jgi:predicted metal-binding membrane protein
VVTQFDRVEHGSKVRVERVEGQVLPFASQISVWSLAGLMFTLVALANKGGLRPTRRGGC